MRTAIGSLRFGACHLLPGFSVDEHAVACRGHLVAHAARQRDPLDSTQPTSGVFVPPGRERGWALPKGWAPRELRHSFVSLLSRSGMTIEEIAHLVGHASTSVTERVYRRNCALSSHAGRVPSTSSSRETLSGPAGQEAGDLVRQRMYVDRLRYVAVEAGCRGPLDVLLHGEGGHCDHRYPATLRIGPDPQ
jgi:transposase-like protein